MYMALQLINAGLQSFLSLTYSPTHKVLPESYSLQVFGITGVCRIVLCRKGQWNLIPSFSSLPVCFYKVRQNFHFMVISTSLICEIPTKFSLLHRMICVSFKFSLKVSAYDIVHKKLRTLSRMVREHLYKV